MLMSVFTATEVEFVTFWGRRFSKVFPTYLIEPKDFPSLSLHFMC